MNYGDSPIKFLTNIKNFMKNVKIVAADTSELASSNGLTSEGSVSSDGTSLDLQEITK